VADTRSTSVLEECAALDCPDHLRSQNAFGKRFGLFIMYSLTIHIVVALGVAVTPCFAIWWKIPEELIGSQLPKQSTIEIGMGFEKVCEPLEKEGWTPTHQPPASDDTKVTGKLSRPYTMYPCGTYLATSWIVAAGPVEVTTGHHIFSVAPSLGQPVHFALTSGGKLELELSAHRVRSENPANKGKGIPWRLQGKNGKKVKVVLLQRRAQLMIRGKVCETWYYPNDFEIVVFTQNKGPKKVSKSQ
jgi:hypothetical protein